MSRKFLLTTVIFCLIPGFIFAQNLTFRDADWGMSKAEVKETEGQKLLQEKPGTLYYTDTFQGYQMYVVYKFQQEKDQLMEGQYILQEDLPGPEQYIQAFQDVETALTEQLGEAKIDTTLFQSKEYMGNSGKYPEALSEGDIRFQTMWENENSKVISQLWNGQKIRLAVQYVSKEFQEK